jgi:hypothetical protein
MLHTVHYWFGKIFHLLLESRHADCMSWESRQSVGSLGYLGSLYGCRSQTAVLTSLDLTLSTILHCWCSLPIMEPLNLIRTMSHGAVSATGGLAGVASGAIAAQEHLQKRHKKRIPTLTTLVSISKITPVFVRWLKCRNLEGVSCEHQKRKLKCRTRSSGI